MTASCAHAETRYRPHPRHRVSSPLAHAALLQETPPPQVLWAADGRGISRESKTARGGRPGRNKINKTKRVAHGKSDDERHGCGERCHDEHGAQCDGIRIARGPLCLRRQCGDECRRVANSIDQLNGWPHQHNRLMKKDRTRGVLHRHQHHGYVFAIPC